MADGTYAKGLASALDEAIAELERAAGKQAGEKASRQRAQGAPAGEGYGAAREEEQAPSAAASSAPPATAAPPPAPAQAPAPGASYGGVPYAPPAPAPAAAPPPEVITSNLSMQIGRLETLRDWMRDDPAFGRLVDSLIGQQVQAAERRQRVFSGVLSVASLVVGWLLTAFSPIGLSHLLGR